jgi:hypothetical protein
VERAGQAAHASGSVGSSLYRRFAAVGFSYIEIGRGARQDRDDRIDLFASQLIDLATAILGAEVSPETKKLMRSRQR